MKFNPSLYTILALAGLSVANRVDHADMAKRQVAKAAAAAGVGTAGAAIVGVSTATANNPDPQNSLTLTANQAQGGLTLDGQQTPAANQVASATSGNNFINFCLTRSDLPLTNGAQVKTGSCNPTVMGVIAAQANMPSCKFSNPPNNGVIKALTDFTITMNIKNLVTGNFVNAQKNYFAAPQNTDASGNVIGHSHVVIEAIDSLTTTTPADPTTFAFFKGLNAAAVGGILSATVTGGLPVGTYKMSSINTAANHQPVLVAVAQHGSLDDVVYFTVTANGVAAAANTQGAAAVGAGATAAGGVPGAGAPQGAGNVNGVGTGAGAGSGAGENKGGRRCGPRCQARRAKKAAAAAAASAAPSPIVPPAAGRAVLKRCAL